MTISLTPGCFESFLFYRAGAPECDVCPLASACRSAVIERAPRVARTVSQLDTRFSQDRAADLAPWLQKRLRRPDATALQRKSIKAQETLDGWKRLGINVFELRHRMNPAQLKESPTYAAFQSIIDNGAGFTRRDVIEDVRLAANLTKVCATRITNIVCDALLEAGVVKAESRGILCLT